VSITVELTYDLAKLLGTRHLELEGAATVGDALRLTRAHFAEQQADFDRLTRVTALAVNGVLINHRNLWATPLTPGDRVSFLKAAAGG